MTYAVIFCFSPLIWTHLQDEVDADCWRNGSEWTSLKPLRGSTEIGISQVFLYLPLHQYLLGRRLDYVIMTVLFKSQSNRHVFLCRAFSFEDHLREQMLYTQSIVQIGFSFQHPVLHYHIL